MSSESAFDQWMLRLEARQLLDLTFSEVSRSLRALSANYVERRQRLHEGAPLSGAGKRAAFALFYGPLHFLIVREVVSALGLRLPAGASIVDLGCGTGAAGAAWASTHPNPPGIVGLDRNQWALGEAAETYRAFGLKARTRQGDFAVVPWPAPAALVAAFAINELPDPSRHALLPRVLARAGEGDAVLVVEPLAGFVAPWWREWREAFAQAGGRADEWRFRVDLPAVVTKLDRAAGLNHRELTARTLLLPGNA